LTVSGVAEWEEASKFRGSASAILAKALVDKFTSLLQHFFGYLEDSQQIVHRTFSINSTNLFNKILGMFCNITA
jgi:hypothetical protein